ncbi:hypothetical protein SH661x_002310 [Planctomicrobium sp. SH661]|uniref:hypothetical protein n=1 Tax=Planctomicrobium sp. SH661 TaxID=3448124 RepID=UPI003F5C3375
MSTTRIKLLVARAGQGFSQSPGEEIEVDYEEALRMVEAGQAVVLSAPVLTPDSPSEAPGEDATEAPDSKPNGRKKTAGVTATPADPSTKEPS